MILLVAYLIVGLLVALAIGYREIKNGIMVREDNLVVIGNLFSIIILWLPYMILRITE